MRQLLKSFKGAGRKTKILCIAFLTAAVFFYLFVITRFSAQDAEESGNLSYEIAQDIAKFIETVSSRLSDEDIPTLAEYFEHPVRKLAHFMEYGILGGLFCASFLPLIEDMRRSGYKARRLYIVNTILVFLLAGLDEFHQFFVPGRYASFLDVLLDTSGCIVFCIFLYFRFDRKKYR